MSGRRSYATPPAGDGPGNDPGTPPAPRPALCRGRPDPVLPDVELAGPPPLPPPPPPSPLPPRPPPPDPRCGGCCPYWQDNIVAPAEGRADPLLIGAHGKQPAGPGQASRRHLRRGHSASSTSRPESRSLYADVPTLGAVVESRLPGRSGGSREGGQGGCRAGQEEVGLSGRGRGRAGALLGCSGWPRCWRWPRPPTAPGQRGRRRVPGGRSRAALARVQADIEAGRETQAELDRRAQEAEAEGRTAARPGR